MSHDDFTGSRWIKSSRSQPNANCVELAGVADMVGVRDSKLGSSGPVLRFGSAQATTFFAAVKQGELDL